MVFCSYRCFIEKLRCEKNSVSERFFLFTCGILKHFFFVSLVKRFVYDFFNFRLVLVVVLRFLESHVNFMLIRRFFMYFADFRANFCVLLTNALFHWFKWVLKKPVYLSKL